MNTKRQNTMRRLIVSTYLFMALLLMAGTAAATESMTEKESVPGAVGPDRSGGKSLLALSDAEAEALSPLHRQMRQILLKEQDLLSDLYAEFIQETDSQKALAIQYRIRQVKITAEADLLKTQAAAARKQNRIQAAEKLEASADRVLNQISNRP